MTTKRLDRYPGVRPFADSQEDQAKFFGRSIEIDSLFNRIVATRLLVLFGQSGLGKTSLLRAGVYPRLRQHRMLPLEVRVGQTRDGRSLVAVVAEAATLACRDQDIDYTPGEGNTLWEFFKTAMFWRNQELLTPVLVLDQFEEIFTLLGPEQRRTEAEQIGATATGVMPTEVRVRQRDGKASTVLSEDPPNVKIVLSLREEHVGALEELSTEIPGIFQDRLRLAPLAEAQACEAIRKPAELPQIVLADQETRNFSVPAFTYQDDALSDMLTVLKGKSGTIEPMQLQMLCQHVEEIAATRARERESITIGRDMLGGQVGLKKVFRNYYRKKLRELPWRERQRVGELCEVGLLTPDGHRLMLEQSQIEKHYHVSAQTLYRIVNSGLLRQEPRLESVFFEISHDNLAQPILTSRPFWRHVPKKTRYAIMASAVAIATIIGLQIYNHIKLSEALDRSERLVETLIGEDLYGNLRRLGDIGVLEKVQDILNEHYKQTTKLRTLLARRNRAAVFRDDGDLQELLGKLPEAEKDYTAARKAYASLLASGLSPEEARNANRQLAIVLSRLGRVAIAEGDLPAALDYSKKSLVIRERLHEQNPLNSELAADLLEGKMQEEEIALAQHNEEEAKADLEEILKLKEATEKLHKNLGEDNRRWILLGISADISNARLYALIYRKNRSISDLKSARDYFVSALKSSWGYVREHPNDSEAVNLYATTISSVIDFFLNPEMGLNTENPRSSGEVKRVIFLVDAATELRRQLRYLGNAEPRNMQTKHQLALSYMVLAKVAVPAAVLLVRDNPSEKDKKRAGMLYGSVPKWYEKALKGLSSLCESDHSNLAWKMDLARAQVGYGIELRARRRNATARSYFQKGLASMVELVSRDPTNIRWKYDFIYAVSRSVGILEAGERKHYLQEVLRILKGLQREGQLDTFYATFGQAVEKALGQPAAVQ